MYISIGVAAVVAVLAILMMLNIVPMTPQLVGGGFLVMCLGFLGPVIIRTP